MLKPAHGTEFGFAFHISHFCSSSSARGIHTHFGQEREYFLFFKSKCVFAPCLYKFNQSKSFNSINNWLNKTGTKRGKNNQPERETASRGLCCCTTCSLKMTQSPLLTLRQRCYLQEMSSLPCGIKFPRWPCWLIGPALRSGITLADSWTRTATLLPSVPTWLALASGPHGRASPLAC